MASESSQSRELAKWENYYAQLPAEQILAEDRGIYREIAAAIREFLPAGSTTLEAACGSGLQSLELARNEDYRVSLMDFSPNAVDRAKEIFQLSGLPAETFKVGDIFAQQETGRNSHDLVFNSGVLEHYDFEHQVAFLKGMADLSKNYLLVLVPNRECYWYWIYRIQHAVNGAWPFGYERPAASYQAAIQAAGLHYLGKRFFAAEAITLALRQIEGLSPELRELIIQVHQQEIISPAQRGYLVGFLAARRPAPPPPGWAGEDIRREKADSEWPDAAVALAADALANQIAVRHQCREEAANHHLTQQYLGRLEQRIRELEKIIQDITPDSPNSRGS